MSGPFLIRDTDNGALYDASGSGDGDRKFWVYRERRATVFATRADAERVMREKFSALTAGRNEIIKASVAAQPALLLTRCAT